MFVPPAFRVLTSMSVRFFAATTIAFEPLPPGVSPAAFAPMLRMEARRAFADRLRERGLVDVRKGGSERVRIDRQGRVRFTAFAASDPLEADGLEADTLPLECWVGVWTVGDEGRVVTGGYPAVQLRSHLGLEADVPGLTRSQGAAREEFFSLVRAVE